MENIVEELNVKIGCNLAKSFKEGCIDEKMCHMKRDINQSIENVYNAYIPAFLEVNIAYISKQHRKFIVNFFGVDTKFFLFETF